MKLIIKLYKDLYRYFHREKFEFDYESAKEELEVFKNKTKLLKRPDNESKLHAFAYKMKTNSKEISDFFNIFVHRNFKRKIKKKDQDDIEYNDMVYRKVRFFIKRQIHLMIEFQNYMTSFLPKKRTLLK